MISIIGPVLSFACARSISKIQLSISSKPPGSPIRFCRTQSQPPASNPSQTFFRDLQLPFHTALRPSGDGRRHFRTYRGGPPTRPLSIADAEANARSHNTSSTLPFPIPRCVALTPDRSPSLRTVAFPDKPSQQKMKKKKVGRVESGGGGIDLRFIHL